MDAVVINLDRRVDRWKAFLADSRPYKVPKVRRFSAIEPEAGNGHISKGELGCFLSHRAVWENVKENTLILEDDAKITRQYSIPKLPDDFDLFYLGGNHRLFGARPGQRMGYWKEDNRTIRMCRCDKTLTTHAYIISPKGAEMALRLTDEVQVDVALWQIQALGNSYYITPSLFVQRDSFSDIHGKRINFEGIT